MKPKLTRNHQRYIVALPTCEMCHGAIPRGLSGTTCGDSDCERLLEQQLKKEHTCSKRSSTERENGRN